MKNSIVMVFVSLSANVLMANAQMSNPWTNPYFFYHYNAPLPPQKTSTHEMDGNIKHHLSDYDDQFVSDSLGAHSFLISTCVRELRSTKADLAQTTQRLNDTYTEVESIKDELNNVMDTVENLKKVMNATKADLAQTTQRFNDTYSEVETIKVELKGNSQMLTNVTNVMGTVENLKNTVNERTSPVVDIGRMPTSCEDLQRIGNKKNGFFSIMGQNKIQTVYCNFAKQKTDQNFQSLIGYNDVKSSPVYFHALRTTTPFFSPNTVVPFDMFRSNAGNAINSTGVFVAPRPGTYFFSFLAISANNLNARVDLQMKNATADWFKIGQAYGTTNAETLTIQSTLQLIKGDQIRLFNRDVSGLHEQNDANFGPWTHFVGFLLEEDIF